MARVTEEHGGYGRFIELLFTRPAQEECETGSGHLPDRNAERLNRMRSGSPRGGQTAEVLFSFRSTCQRLGVEPWAYLQDVLTRLPATPAGQLGDLLPDHWQAARQASTATPSAPATDTTTPSADSAS